MPIVIDLWERREHAPDDDFWYAPAVGATASGVAVDERGAMGYSPVWACVNAIAGAIAQLPLHMYRRLPGGGKDRAPEHPLYTLLHDLPNPYITSYHLRLRTQAQALLWGNSYLEIERDNAGRPIALWPLPPDRVKAKQSGTSIGYEIRLPTGETRMLPWENVFHLAGLGFDGLQGYSVITMARESLALGIAAERFGGKLFKQGVRQSGYLQHPGNLSETALGHLKQSIVEQHAGLDNAMRVMVLEEGMQFKESFIPPNDAQFLETRQFEVVEVCRWFNVPPHMARDLSRATFSNIEHQSIDFVVHTLGPWLRCWENTIQRDLVDQGDRARFFAAFLVEGLLRGDYATRTAGYSTMKQNGILNADEIREMENMNPQPDGQGKIYYVPLNMIPAGTAAEPAIGTAGKPAPAGGEPEPRASAGGGADATLAEIEQPRALPAPAPQGLEVERERRMVLLRGRVRTAHRPLFLDLFRRVVRADCAAMKALARKHLGREDADSFREATRGFYERHEGKVAAWSAPGLTTYAESLRVYLGQMQTAPITADMAEIALARAAACGWQYSTDASEELAGAEPAVETIEALLARREQEWPGERADRELDEAGAAFEAAMAETETLGRIRIGEREERTRRSAAERHRLAATYRPLFEEAGRRLIRAETAEVRKAARAMLSGGEVDEFMRWMHDYYAEHPALIVRRMGSVYEAYGEAVQAAAAEEIGEEPGVSAEFERFIAEYRDGYAGRHVRSAEGQLRSLVRQALGAQAASKRAAGDDALGLVEERLDQWEEKSPERIGSRETIRASGAFSTFTYFAAGLGATWVAIGKSCPYCESLDGRTIRQGGAFLGKGQSFDPLGTGKPLKNYGQVGHPPAHGGCDCMVVGGF